MKIDSLSVLTRYICKGLHKFGFQNVAVDLVSGVLNKKICGRSTGTRKTDCNNE